MKKVIVAVFFTGFIALMAFKKSQTGVIFQKPQGWPEPVYNFKKNPLNEKKIALGRMLFYDPLLSRDSTISCSSCHSQYTAFTHIDHSLSHGIEGKIGTRNSPALMNLAWSKELMWDGSVKHLDEQARSPIVNPLEMGETMEHVVQKLQADVTYAPLFYNAFGDTVVKPEYVYKALSQFMLTLVSANARYDKVMRGEEQFTTKEASGYGLFKKNCSSCHTEPLFTNGRFENNGLIVDTTLNDIGAMKITKRHGDSLKFKVPTLRNIEYSRPYMHDGRFKDLNQVLNNYIRGIQHTPTLSRQLRKGIYLTPPEKSDLMAFLLTLSDKEFLTDPRFSYPKK